MIEDVSILIPFRSDHGHRDKLLNWVINFYQTCIPEVEICIGESSSALFSRSQAINAAANKANRNIFVIADGDIFYERQILMDAIHLLDQCAWIVPYHKVFDLSPSFTNKLLDQDGTIPMDKEGEERVWDPVGGINIISRENFEKVNGFDERFLGWGGEDDAFGIALNTLCGNYRRLSGYVYHLWHPPTGREGNPHYYNNLSLLQRYYYCAHNQEQMQRLVSESGHHEQID